MIDKNEKWSPIHLNQELAGYLLSDIDMLDKV